MALFDQNKASIKQGTDEEYMRTQTRLIRDDGDAPSPRLFPDPRLPKKFKYHFGGQMGWITIPKGRIVAIDPEEEFKHFDDNKYYNLLTIANGGADVEERNDDPESDADTYVRKANKPCGVAFVNVYQDIKNSFAGNVPTYVTRNTIHLPYFLNQEDAEGTEWGSIYGEDIKPGDKVMSDENGRFVKYAEGKLRADEFDGDDGNSGGGTTQYQLSSAIHPDAEAESISYTIIDTSDDDADVSDDYEIDSIDNINGTVDFDSEDLDDAKYEIKITYRSVLSNMEQKVGMVVQVNKDLVPAGWLKWVMPEEERTGEYGFQNDNGFRTKDISDDGYPYDPAYRDGYDKDPYRPTGIPGLHDGSNIEKEYEEEELGVIPAGIDSGEKFNFRTLHTPISNPGEITVEAEDENGSVSVSVDFVDADTGLVIVKLEEATDEETTVTITYKATGQHPGMPSNLDFEGVAGSADILLQI